MPPTVTIVTATYNRSNVLRLTIESVLASSFSDWEMIVVGDACSDDTAAVVDSFGDARIRFVNLPRNHGEQSAPNNEGVRLARGRYVAFLNHDDLWTPSHLAIAVAVLDRGLPFVHTLGISVPHDGVPCLTGATPEGRYHPSAAVPASLWVFRRELFDRVGPWRAAQTIHLAPSADWLFRAWKAGIPIHGIAEVTAVCVTSGRRARSYSDRLVSENERWALALREDPRLVEKELAAIAARASINNLGIASHLLRGIKNALMRLCFAAGVHPFVLRAVIFYGGRGGFLNRLRKNRGLPPLPDHEVRI
jgi:GT2 family glycosyltransferase